LDLGGRATKRAVFKRAGLPIQVALQATISSPLEELIVHFFCKAKFKLSLPFGVISILEASTMNGDEGVFSYLDFQVRARVHFEWMLMYGGGEGRLTFIRHNGPFEASCCGLQAISGRK
jgi:hypothetical protein